MTEAPMQGPAAPPVRPPRRWLKRLKWAAIAGVVVIGLAGIGGGIAAKRFVDGLGPLDLSPAEIRSTIVVDRDGKLLRPFTTDDGRWRLPVTVEEVDPRFLTLLYGYEDERFLRHRGVDPWAMARAAWQFARSGRVVSGGSTLTMQVARLLEPREDRTLTAKARQIARAFELERRFSKTEILNLYLAMAPYGGNIEGLRAASIAYFGKEPKRLSFAEAALLVALPQSPESRRPDRSPEVARRARDRVLDRARARGLINDAEVDYAKAEPVPSQRQAFPMLAAHAAEEAVGAEPMRKVHRLAIDARLQASLELLAHDRIERLGPKLSAAILVINNATGEVHAHVGGADYFSVERAGSIDLATVFRSPGSALKPFIYALAFESGIAHPETVLNDRPARYGAWAPENFDQLYRGTVTARKALQMSLNLPAVELLDAVGPSRLVARLKAAGAEIEMPKDAAPGLAIGLGGLGIKLTDMAKLFVGIARGGETVPLTWHVGGVIDDAQKLRLVDPVAAWYIADILRGAPPPVNAAGGRIAFKTGTSYGYRDAWAAGFDKNWTIAVWVGRPDGAAVSGLVGRLVAAPILFDAFSRLGVEPEIIPQPHDALIATTATLPPPLKHMRRDVPKSIAASNDVRLEIAYPPDGARIDLGLTGESADTSGPLALKAQGGVLPLTWLVNGLPVTQVDARRPAFWQPDGAGFARVSVMDATGATASVVVRLE